MPPAPLPPLDGHDGHSGRNGRDVHDDMWGRGSPEQAEHTEHAEHVVWELTRTLSSTVEEEKEDIDDAHEAEASSIEEKLDLHTLDLHINALRSTPFATPLLSDDSVGATPTSELFDVDMIAGDRTYSSLPPSPRADASAEFGLDRSLDLGELHAHPTFMKAGGSPRRRHSLGNETEDEGDVFWPALSRRQTMDGDTRPVLSRRTTLEAGEMPAFLASKPPVLEVQPEAPESPDPEQHREHGDGEGEEHGASILDTPLTSPGYDHPVPEASGINLWDLLKDEDAAEHWEGWIADGKWERIQNFLAVPVAVEKVTMFGALLCLDGFLYNFTILPIRATFAASRIMSRFIRGQPIAPIPPAHVQSLLRLILLVIPSIVLMVATDSSKMYHTVRGQDTIKLYVIFNALEIGDRLCCAFGQDVLDTLFARDTLTYSVPAPGKRRKRERVRPVFFLCLSLGYVLVHTLVFFYMLISLNVAINSYDYTLISLLISNQFVEIKGSVFKKFEKENLFQIMCADIVERFQLGLMLVVIAVRNMIEMAGSDLAFLPKSFTRGKSLIERILSPVLFVLASEMVVDWLKHAFIAKFNHVRATVYGRFTDVLAKDVLLAGTVGGRKRKHPILLDQSPLVARRLGIASVPLAVLVIRIAAQIFGMLTSSTHHIDGQIRTDWFWTALKWAAGILITVAAWGCLVALKILLGLGLLSYSALRQAGMDEREAEDTVNDFGRPDVGISKEEMEYNEQTKQYLSSPADDLAEYPAASPALATTLESTPRAAPPPLHPKEKEKGKKKSWRLEEVERWTMVKRIW